MANGYLGKISAIVTANTSELSRNLNAGAKDVRAFAQTVSRDIGRVSSDAQRQFSQIFTPLQKFERALQAAASQKLSFKGFDGAIRTVEQLRSRLASLQDQRIINLAVKASGLGSIKELRESVSDVASREIKILAQVGGLDKLRELRQEIAASEGKTVQLKVGAVGLQQIDDALERFQGFSNRQIEILANVGGLDKLRQIQDGINSVDGKTVIVNVGEVNARELDEIAVKLSGLDNKTLKTVIDVVGQAGLDKALQTQRQLASAAEQITKPLNAARAEFEKLPLSVQGGFINALSRAQGEVKKLESDIVDGVSISETRFAALEKVVLRTAAAISRFREASNLAEQGPTGQELAFRAPRVQQELQANLAARQAAAAAPASALARDTGINRSVSGLQAVAREIANVQAQIESGSELRLDTREAEANLDKLLARSERLRARLQDQVQVAVIGPNLGATTEIGDRLALARARQEEAAFAERAAEQTEREVRAANRLLLQQVAIRDAVRERVRNFAQDFAPAPVARVDLFDTGESDRQSVLREAEALADQINRLPAQTRSALSSTTDRFNGIYNSVRTATGGVGVLRDAISGLRSEISSLPESNFVPSSSLTESAAPIRAAQESRDARLQDIRDTFQRSVTALPVNAGDLRQQFQALGGQLQGLNIADRLSIAPLLEQYVQLEQATNGAGQEQQRFAEKLRVILAIEERINAARSSRAARFAQSREATAESLPDFAQAFQSDQIRRVTGELQGVQSVLLAVGATASGPAAQAYERLRLRTQQAIRENNAGWPSVRRELELLQQQAAQAAAATGRISVGQALRRVSRAGDIGRAGIDNFSLALNQAAFAIDDFFSSTGGLEFKIRAISNNITQLAFILGGTTGLFAGLAVVIGAQLGVAIARWITNAEQAERQQEALKRQAEALNSSLSDQKSKVDDLAQSYRRLADEIRSSTRSPETGRIAERREAGRELQQQQAEARREVIAQADPRIGVLRGRRAQLQQQLQDSGNVAERQLIQRRIDANVGREDAVVREIEQAAARRAGGNREQLEARRETIRNRIDSLGTELQQRQRRGLDTANTEAQIREFGRELAVVTTALQQIGDRAAAAAASIAGPLQDRISEAQRSLSQQFGSTRTRAQAILEQSGERLARAAEDAGAGLISEGELRNRVNAIGREPDTRAAIEAASGLLEFGKSLEQATTASQGFIDDTKRLIEELTARQRQNQDEPGIQARIDEATKALRAAESERLTIAGRVGAARLAAEGTIDQGELQRQRQLVDSAVAAGRGAAEGARQRDQRIADGVRLGTPENQRRIDEFRDQFRRVLEANAAGGIGRGGVTSFLQDQARAAAPALFSLADAVQNAILQGPSRAALEGTDVSTVEGQRELNRLLRGDDPARNENLVELRKQSEALDKLVKSAEEEAKARGIVLDLNAR